MATEDHKDEHLGASRNNGRKFALRKPKTTITAAAAAAPLGSPSVGHKKQLGPVLAPLKGFRLARHKTKRAYNVAL